MLEYYVAKSSRICMDATSSKSDIGTSEASAVEQKNRSSMYDASVDTTDDSGAGCSPHSLLSVLCQLTPSQLACEADSEATAPTGAKRWKGTKVKDPKNMKSVHCILTIICTSQLESCSVSLVGSKFQPRRVSSINITSTKHQNGKAKEALKRKREQNVVEALKQYD